MSPLDTAFARLADAVKDRFSIEFGTTYLQRRKELNHLISQLTEFGAGLYRSKSATAEEWAVWWRIFEAAHRLRAVLWAQRKGLDAKFVAAQVAAVERSLGQQS